MARSSPPRRYLLTCNEGPALEELEQLLSKTKGKAQSSLASVAEVASRRKSFSGDIKNGVTRIVSANLTQKQIKKIRESNLCYVEEDALAVTCAPGGINVKALKHASDAMQEYPVPSGLKQIDADIAWSRSTGKGIKIGVLDTGIDAKHPDLKGRVKRGVSFVDNVQTSDDDNGHGTHCSGIIAANQSKKDGLFGVAPDAFVFPVKVLNYKGVGPTSAIISGIEWCINQNIQIISMSFRLPGVQRLSVALRQACQIAWEKGMILVAATGNDREENPHWSVGWPARFETVLGVGAVDKVGTIAPFSNIGQGVDLVAPGVDILSTYRGSRYRVLSGTSQAAPHVAGAAALLKAYRPSLTNEDVYKVLRETTDPLSVPEPDDMYGSGMLNASWALEQLDTVIS